MAPLILYNSELNFRSSGNHNPGSAIGESLFKRYASRMNIIRFCAMLSIVWGHSLYGWEKGVFSDAQFRLMQPLMLEAGRLGTICFFIISGFFVHDKVLDGSIAVYLKNTFHKQLLPWLACLSLFVSIETFHQPYHGVSDTMKLICTLYKAYVFHAAFWFIPVSIISSLILLLLRRWVFKMHFGGILLLVSLFYAVNLYFGWISANHTKAFAGYIFYMWLGLQLRSRLVTFHNYISRLSDRTVLILLVSAFLLACLEGRLLTSVGSEDPYASLRVTNGFASVIFFTALLKSSHFRFISHLNPRKYIYGVYLIHCIIITEMMPLMSGVASATHVSSHLALYIVLQVLFFSLAMAISYVSVCLFYHFKVVFRGTEVCSEKMILATN
ncbi:acyltransferase [Mucilaginibacter sp. RS28]|uniref:Acyltransferase n=1 Tax=Mucilaginibacter straminoryzae TaxID=2932774 RepID=A0A9X2B7R4_9SPHI|nr:acyltransferase [Mucilaginibacter straminoryzae]MCJ8208621.1 acyltransferase [Mucilaginibacter straminoryzae]